MPKADEELNTEAEDPNGSALAAEEPKSDDCEEVAKGVDDELPNGADANAGLVLPNVEPAKTPSPPKEACPPKPWPPNDMDFRAVCC